MPMLAWPFSSDLTRVADRERLNGWDDSDDAVAPQKMANIMPSWRKIVYLLLISVNSYIQRLRDEVWTESPHSTRSPSSNGH